MTGVLLHDYYRSSAAYRVRIALNLKGVEYQRHQVNLAEGEQRDPAYRALNPQGFVPMLEIDDHRLTQSLAIIAYLDATRPAPPLLPKSPVDAAQVRAMALTVACDIHPLNNLRVLKYLSNELDQPQEARDAWYRHWVKDGLEALESMARTSAGDFLFGDTVTLADICLVPQLYNARRFAVTVADFPTLRRVDENANALGAFAVAHPDRQETHA